MPSELPPQPSKRANRLANRARMLYLVLPTLAVAVLVVISHFILRVIADDSARRLARQYSIEAAANFLSSTNAHFVLVQQVSRSTSISRWLAYEDDPDAKAMAFNEIMGYVVFSPEAYIMFTAYTTLQAYHFNIGLTLEEFQTSGCVGDVGENQWFFDTRDAEKPFILNVQRNWPGDAGEWKLHLWSNHRMYYDDRFVGVVTIGYLFEDIFYAIFGDFNPEHKRGYIIDRNGAVRVDSAMLLEVAYHGIPVFPALPEALENPALVSLIADHMETMVGGLFLPGARPSEAIRLYHGDYRYGGIAPIIGTDWSVVVLSNYMGAFAGTGIMPLLVSAFAVLVLSVVLGNGMVRRMALVPLFKLTQSVALSANTVISKDLYGLDRDDEIGDLARTIQYMRTMQENSRAKSKFLARMSHEIRTPISAVLGISEIQLNNPELPLDIEESFAKIHSSANTLLGIVNDILDLSKVEAGKMELINEKYEVASLLGDVVQLNLAYLGSKPLAFSIDVDENMPSFLIGDELRIKQVLNNLLSNAFKYTEKGSVNLKVVSKASTQENHVNVVAIVQDTGRGMTKTQLKSLFDEYSRFHEKEDHFETGTGLGMPITYNLLQMMNATIDVDSEVGKGTIITVVLPQEIGNPETLGPEMAQNLKNFNTSAQSVAKRLSFTPEPMPYGRVLVVDDVDANLYVARGLLGLYHLQIETCSCGRNAIEKVRSGEVYDIIFMDQMMPEMNGMETTSAIRKLNYTRPIVALTADALVGQAEKFLLNGFDGFLSKPIQTVHLNALLHKFVKDAHAEAAEAARKETAAASAKAPLNNEANAEHQGIDDYFDNFMETSGINDKIRMDIVRNRKNVVREIADAIEANDLKTAQRHAHTLKGLVGAIGEKDLFDFAEKTETAFRAGLVPTELVEALGLEMERVLARLRKHLNEPEEPAR